jgi:hypothetical protein
MNQISALHDFLQAFDARFGRFQAGGFRDPNKVAIGEPFEYIEHDDLVPPDDASCILDAKGGPPVSSTKSAIYGHPEWSVATAACNFARRAEHAA